MNEGCRQIRKNIVEVSKASKHGHIPTCFSVVEMMCAIYDTIRHDPKKPNWDERDIFILSKGHAALAHYCVLAHFGYFSIEGVYRFGGFMSNFGCHADRLKIPGVEASTGSLGHGIGIAVGMALAFKIMKSGRRVFALIGDGESNEGSVWEAVLVAVSLKLDNLTILYDNNMSHSRGLQIHNPAAHFRGFGCSVLETEGNDVDALKQAVSADGLPGMVKVVMANTQKGYGSRMLIENQYEWHRKSPNENEYETLMRELDA